MPVRLLRASRAIARRMSPARRLAIAGLAFSMAAVARTMAGACRWPARIYRASVPAICRMPVRALRADSQRSRQSARNQTASPWRMEPYRRRFECRDFTKMRCFVAAASAGGRILLRPPKRIGNIHSPRLRIADKSIRFDKRFPGCGVDGSIVPVKVNVSAPPVLQVHFYQRRDSLPMTAITTHWNYRSLVNGPPRRYPGIANGRTFGNAFLAMGGRVGPCGSMRPPHAALDVEITQAAWRRMWCATAQLKSLA